MGGCAMANSVGSDGETRSDAGALAIARGINRLLVSLAVAPLNELTLPNGRRADIFAIGADSTMIIVEIKSGVADYRCDSKWPDYRTHCDQLYFGVDAAFPVEILPLDVGIIRADRYGGAIVRDAPVHRLSPARRKALMVRFARVAALRLVRVYDPEAAIPEAS